MDISQTIAEMKRLPGFSENVGMVLSHNGVVREWSRTKTGQVTGVNVTPDRKRIEEICREIEAREGIFKVAAEAKEGDLQPGDDLLFLVVAGDVRENVIPALSDLLNKVKAEAVSKTEIMG